MPGSTTSGSKYFTPLEHITFDGKDSEDVTVFLQSVKRVALDQERQRDDKWMADYVEACLTGEALRWFSTLEESALCSWKTLRDAFLHRFVPPANRPASVPAPAAAIPAPPAVATAVARAPIPKIAPRKQSRYPLPSEVRTSIFKGAQLLKVMMIGDSGVGKSCLRSRWLNFGWPCCTRAGEDIEYEKHCVNYNGKGCELHVWDVPGRARPRDLTPKYTANLDAVWIVYDVTEKSSFDNVRDWHKSVSHIVSSKKNVLLLVGNKVDLAEKVVTTKQGQALATELGALYFEISAKANHGIEQISGGFVPYFTGSQ
ncbi:hypothetical protein FRB95_007159 [Tulasnella sp. JGI-2019a]|nr:hypothetical protein FRB95_007159 [Tulasnella sp. JGI-2019a]